MNNFDDISYWAWRTHQPLIHWVMTALSPELVVELGMGCYSTPLFLKYSPKQLICVENDLEWMRYVQKKYKFKTSYSVLFHEVPGISIGTLPMDLSIDTRNAVIEYYQNLKAKFESAEHRILFIDNFTAFRQLALTYLCGGMDAIIFHDCEPNGVEVYDYDLTGITGFDLYILKSPSSWTGLLLCQRLGIMEDQLRKEIQPFIFEFCEQNKLPGLVLEKCKDIELERNTKKGG
ncbi:MAG: hypothetical protein WC942_02930 [Clostridia bacterium]|jgi:hypothetical protein